MREKHMILKKRLDFVRMLNRNLGNDLVCLAMQRFALGLDKFVAFSCEKDGYLSYARRPEHKYSVKSRVRVKPGRFIRQFLTDEFLREHGWNYNISDEMIGIFSQMCGFAEKDGTDPILLKGRDITQKYREAFGSSSCMTGSGADNVQLYELNPDKVSLAIIDGTFKARALVWTVDSGETYLDRAYGDSEAVNELNAWAERNGWASWENEKADRYEVTLEEPDRYPYMDSFRHMKTLPGGKIRVSMYRGDYDLDRTDGLLEDDDSRCCSCCDETLDEEDCYTVDGACYCQTCYSDRYRSCERCCEADLHDNMRTVYNNGEETWCEHCVENHALYCAGSSEYYSIRNHRFVDVDGENWEVDYASDNAYCWRDGTWHQEEEAIEEESECSEVNNEAT